MRFLREMRQSLQDGCGCDENAQPYRVHPLRNGIRACPTNAVCFRYASAMEKRKKRSDTARKQQQSLRRNEYERKEDTGSDAVRDDAAFLAACGAKGNDKQADMSGDSSAMTGEPKTAEEALALHKELLERENALPSENAELWEKVFMAADKGMTMQGGRQKLRRLPAGYRRGR